MPQRGTDWYDRSMTRRPARWAIVMLALAAASCSGGDKTADDTTVAPTTVAPSTTAPSTTVAPSTTAPTTTAAQTTPAPTTPTTPAPTTPPTTAPLDLRGTIERDVNIGEQALFTIGANPSAPEAKTIAAQYFTGIALQNVLDAIDSLVADDLVTQPSPDVANVIVVTTEPVLDAAGTHATAETCRIDATWMLALDAGSGIRVPVNTTVTKTVSATRFTFADGIWKLDGGEVISSEDGDASCA